MEQNSSLTILKVKQGIESRDKSTEFAEDGQTKRNEMKNTSENISDDIPGSDDSLIDKEVEGEHN